MVEGYTRFSGKVIHNHVYVQYKRSRTKKICRKCGKISERNTDLTQVIGTATV